MTRSRPLLGEVQVRGPQLQRAPAAAEPVVDVDVGGGEGRVADHQPDPVLGAVGEEAGAGGSQQALFGRDAAASGFAFLAFLVFFFEAVFVFEDFAFFFGADHRERAPGRGGVGDDVSAASSAKTEKLWAPSSSAAVWKGLAQGSAGALSTEQRKVAAGKGTPASVAVEGEGRAFVFDHGALGGPVGDRRVERRDVDRGAGAAAAARRPEQRDRRREDGHPAELLASAEACVTGIWW